MRGIIINKGLKDIRQVLIFALVGAVNTGLEILILNFFWWITGCYKGNINYLFKFIAFILCSVLGYLMNKKFTFKSREEDKKAYVKYAIIFATLSFIESVIIAEMTKIQMKIIPIYMGKYS